MLLDMSYEDTPQKSIFPTILVTDVHRFFFHLEVVGKTVKLRSWQAGIFVLKKNIMLLLVVGCLLLLLLLLVVIGGGSDSVVIGGCEPWCWQMLDSLNELRRSEIIKMAQTWGMNTYITELGDHVVWSIHFGVVKRSLLKHIFYF